MTIRPVVFALHLALVVAGAAGCASQRAAAPPPSPPAPAAEATPPSTASPPGASEEEMRFIPPPPLPEPPPPAGAVDAGEGWTTPAAPLTTYGYRVQIFASGEKARAEEVATQARGRFAEPVYVEFEAPLYKVRVGDCITRHEADVLKERAIAQGYDGPWVAETMVQAR